MIGYLKFEVLKKIKQNKKHEVKLAIKISSHF